MPMARAGNCSYFLPILKFRKTMLRLPAFRSIKFDWNGWREFGGCFLGLELWRRLELDRFFEDGLDDEEADVPWSRVAAVLAINRLCAPGSELAIEKRWFPTTALDDLLQIE